MTFFDWNNIILLLIFVPIGEFTVFTYAIPFFIKVDKWIKKRRDYGSKKTC